MPSTGKHPNSFAIHSARSLHWSIFVSEHDCSCCLRFSSGGDLVRNRSVMPLGSIYKRSLTAVPFSCREPVTDKPEVVNMKQQRMNRTDFCFSVNRQCTRSNHTRKTRQRGH
jgi:hypothetical protein